MTTAIKLTDICSKTVLDTHLSSIQYPFRNYSKKLANLTVADLYSRYKAFLASPGSEADPRVIVGMRQVEVFFTEVLPTLNTWLVVTVFEESAHLPGFGDFKRIKLTKKGPVLTPKLRSASETVDKSFDIKVAEKYLQLLQSAQRRHLDFNLSLVDVRNILLRKTCYYSGVKFHAAPGHEHSRTVDRLDCNKGYVKGNVVACTDKMNTLKEKMFEHKDLDLKAIQKMLIVLLRSTTGT